MTRAASRLSLVALILATALIVALATAPARAASRCANARASAATVPGAAVGAAVQCLVNVRRRASRLRALRASEPLRAAATAHSADMVARGFFDHVSPGGGTLVDRARRAGYPGRTLAEAIGWATGALATPASIVRMWIHSPPHRAVLLHPRVREIGVGVAVGTPVGGAAGGAVYTLDVGCR